MVTSTTSYEQIIITHYSLWSYTVNCCIAEYSCGQRNVLGQTAMAVYPPADLSNISFLYAKKSAAQEKQGCRKKIVIYSIVLYLVILWFSLQIIMAFFRAKLSCEAK